MKSVLVSLSLLLATCAVNGRLQKRTHALAANQDAFLLHARQAHDNRLGMAETSAAADQDSTDASNTNAQQQTPPAASTTATGNNGGVLGGLLGMSTTTTASPSSSSKVESSTSSSLSSSAKESSSTMSSKPTSSSQSIVTAKSTVTSGTDVSVVDITSTVGSSATASSAADNDDESSGMPKKTMIILIVVASTVGLIAAVWTLLRKWKFSPSRRFENRLNPIDWGHTYEPKNDTAADGTGAALARSNSGAHGVERTNSWGSAAGSARGGQTMSERGDAYSHITGGYERAAPSGGSNVSYNSAPAYPPGYGNMHAPPPPPMTNSNAIYNGGYNNASSYTINMPYEPSRQANQGHYGGY